MTSRVDWRGDEFVKSVVLPAARDGLAAAAVEVERQMRTNLNGPSPSAPGDFPGKDTGDLGRSIASAMTGDLSVGIGTNQERGRHLEYGWHSRAKKGKFLTIPLTDKARRMRRVFSNLRAATPKLRLLRTGKGKLFLVRDVGGRNARMEFWFVLKKAVTVAPRPWAARSLSMAEKKASEKFAQRAAQSAARRVGAMP